MRPSHVPVVEIRPEGATGPLPQGWVAQPIRWEGQEMEVAYDPQRVQVLRATSGQMDRDDRRRIFTEAGWRQVRTDAEGAELWVADREHRAATRLDRLSHGPAVQLPSPAVGLP